MGNVLNLICEKTTPQHWLPNKIQLHRAVDHQSELWKILIFRALGEHIRRTATHEKGTTCGRFQLWAILICRAMSGNICHKPIFKEGAASNQFQLLGILLSGVISDYITGMKNDPFRDLPEDVKHIILSKLALKDIVRTSVVSRKWRFMWQLTPKLHFDSVTMCGKNIHTKRQYIRNFINNVYAVLIQCRGRVVEDLAIKFDFDSMMVGLLNNCVRFAVSSRTKFLAFDLVPTDFADRNDRYMFPFHLLDKGSISRLQRIHLSFVSLQPPPQFSSFPNLQKLDLNLVHVNGKDLEEMLSSCPRLEWLRIVRCHLYDDELNITSPLPCLLCLSVMYCRITSIEFRAMKLSTFEYKGPPVPINLSKSSELKTANIYLFRDILEHAISALANVLINVKHLTLNIQCFPPEVPCLMDCPCKFSMLKHLKLMLLFADDVDSISLASFLSTVCFIEKLELHFCVVGNVYVVHKPTRRLLNRPFSCMKSFCMTGFKACHGQVELLLHIVENTPSLEFLTIDMSNKYKPVELQERDAKHVSLVHGIARRYLEGKISPRCSLTLL